MKTNFICMRMKNHFHINDYALSLALKQRLGTTGKWLFEIVTLMFIGYDEVSLRNWVQIRPPKQSYNALRHNTYNLGQCKMEQQTPILPPPKSRMKQYKSQNAPFSHPKFEGRGSTNFPSILSKIVASCFLVQPQNGRFRKSENLLMVSLQNAFGNFPGVNKRCLMLNLHGPLICNNPTEYKLSTSLN